MRQAAVLASLVLAACHAELDLSPSRFGCDSGGICGTTPGADVQLTDTGAADARMNGADAGQPDAVTGGVCSAGSRNGSWRLSTSDLGEARAGHTMVWDWLASRTMIFGGAGADQRVMALSFGTLSLFELPTFGTPRPAGSTDHSVAFTSNRGMVVFGGHDVNGALLPQTWTFDASGFHNPSWVEAVDAPAAREGHGAVIAAGKMFAFGGCIPSAQSNVGSLDLTAGTWVDEQITSMSPTGRCEHTAVVSSRDADQVVVFGGQGASALDETWLFSVSARSWQPAPIAGRVPPARFGHSAVVDANRDRMIVFGGIGADGQPRNDLWALSLTSWCWAELTPSGSRPAPRSEHAAVTINDHMLLYGGRNTATLPDLWDLSF